MKLLTTSILATLTMCAPAHAQQNCGPRDLVVDRLNSKYSESVQSRGLAPNGQMLEVYANLETGSWTIVTTTPQGISCLRASGQSFENISEVLPEDDPT